MADPGPRAARLVIQSDRRVVREALAAYFADGRGFLVVGHTATVHGLLTLCALGRPDVALIDVNALTARTVKALRETRASFPETDLVVAYTSLSLELLAEAVRAGVTSFVPSSRGLEAVLRLLRQRTRDTRAALPPPQLDGRALTDRELGVISLLSSGHTVSDIAKLLQISPHTVDNHKRRVYTKFGVGSQSLAISRAMALGLVESSPAGGETTSGATGPARATPPAQPSQPSQPGRPLLAVVYGDPGSGMDQVLHTLVGHRIPFVHARVRQQVHQEHWAQWHRGPIITVLVDPVDPDWLAPAGMATPVVVVWSTPPERSIMVEALTAGARALINADDLPQDLPLVLSLASRGYVAVTADLTGDLASWMTNRHLGNGVPDLTAREQEILGLMASGHTIRQVARTLGIAAKTVENTQARLYRKLGTHNRAETLAVAYRLGLLDAVTASDAIRSDGARQGGAVGRPPSTKGTASYPHGQRPP